jgi:hypothetical protein
MCSSFIKKCIDGEAGEYLMMLKFDTIDALLFVVYSASFLSGLAIDVGEEGDRGEDAVEDEVISFVTKPPCRRLPAISIPSGKLDDFWNLSE